MSGSSSKVEIQIVADSSGAVRGFKLAGDGLSGLGLKARGAAKEHQGLLASLGGLKNILLNAGIVYGIKKALDATSEWGTGVLTLSRQLGLSATDASDLAYAAEHVGLSVDQVSKGFGIFEKHLAANDKAVKGFGVSLKDAHGNIQPFTTVLGQVADKFAAMPNGVQKTADALALFGRSGKDLLPLLNLGSKGFADLAGEARRFGLELTGSNLQAIYKYNIAQRELGSAFKGLEIQVGLGLMPILTGLAHVVMDGIGAFRKIPGPVKEFGAVVIGVAGGMKLLNTTIVGIKAIVNQLPGALTITSEALTAEAGAAQTASISTGTLAGSFRALGLALKSVGPIAALFGLYKLGTVHTEAMADKTGKLTDAMVSLEAVAQSTKATIANLAEGLRLNEMSGQDLAVVIQDLAQKGLTDVADKLRAAAAAAGIDLTGGVDSASSSVGGFKGALSGIGSVVSSATQKLKTFDDVLNATLNPQIALSQAVDDLDTKEKALAAALRANKGHLRDHSDAAKATRSAFDDLVTADENYVTSLAKAGRIGASTGNQTKHLIDTLEQQKAKYPELASLIQVYIDKLRAIPHSVHTNITNTIDTVYRKGPGVGFKAAGGPVSANKPYIVGERGPELFVPNISGSIVPNGRPYPNGSARGGDGARAPVIVNITMHGDYYGDNDFEDKVNQAMDRAVRRFVSL